MKKCISFINVTKKFRLYEDKPTTLKEFFTRIAKKKYKEKLLFENLNFDICKGEAVGLIGNNGCGKSTILKMITKIIYPNSGKIIVNGKVSSLLELGAGFDENFTGRQNIYFNASILGVRKKDVDKVIDKIIDFSGLRDVIDVPIRTYSSGMYMRLAFSIAINVNADILIFDEVLAVGDQEFQKKCIEKVKELKKKKKTILFVSHDMEVMRKICDRAIWIDDKKIKMDSKTNLVIDEYLKSEGI